jgi:hypothetical protein
MFKDCLSELLPFFVPHFFVFDQSMTLSKNDNFCAEEREEECQVVWILPHTFKNHRSSEEDNSR